MPNPMIGMFPFGDSAQDDPEISGSSVFVRMLSTLRAPLSTSVQRFATSSIKLVVVTSSLIAMGFLQPPLNLGQLETMIFFSASSRIGKYGMMTRRPRNAGLKILFSSGLSALTSPSGLGHGLGVGAELHDGVGADVRGQEDDGVLEVDLAALAVLEHALVEDLEEQLQDVGMGLLDLVEQDHAVRPAADGLGQHAAFAVADVAGRRALEGRDGVRFLVLRHVDGDQVPLAAVERVGQRQRGLGLADAAGPDEQEDADRLPGSSRLARAVRIRWLMASERVRLADRRALPASTRGSGPCAISSASILPTGMPVQPAMTSAIDLRIDADLHQRRLALERVAARAFSVVELVAQRASVDGGCGRLPVGRAARRGAPPIRSPQISRISLDQLAFFLPALLQLGQPRLRLSAFCLAISASRSA